MSTTHLLPPKGRSRQANVQNTAAELFPTTQGKVDISHILVSPRAQIVVGSSETLVTFRHPSDSPTYFTVGLGANSQTSVIPGFELPAGGLEVITSTTVGIDIDVFYFTSSQT